MYQFLIKKNPCLSILLFLSIVLMAVMNLVEAYLLQTLFDQVILIGPIVAYVLSNLLVHLSFHALNQTLKAKMAVLFTKGRLSCQMQTSLCQDMGQFVNEYTSELAIALDQYLTTSILIIRYVVSFLIAALYIGMMNWVILVILLVSGVILLGLNQMSSPLLVRQQEAVVTSQQKRVNSLQHFYQGYRTFFHYQHLQANYDRVIKSSQKSAQAQAKLNFLLRLFGVLSDNYMNAILFVFTILGVILVGHGQMSLGQLIACVQLSNQIVMPITEIVDLRNQLNTSKDITKPFLENKIDLPILTLDNESTCIRIDIDQWGYGQMVLLQDIHLSFQVGQSYLLLGESGSGKSTFLKFLLGEIEGYSIHGGISPVFAQETDLGLTLVESICMNEPFDQERFDWVLNLVELDSQQAIESAGQKQRVQLARAIYHRRPWLVMDEPISHLDKALATRIMRRILALDVGVIMVSHQQVDLCFNHVYVLSQGRWIEKETS